MTTQYVIVKSKENPHFSLMRFRQNIQSKLFSNPFQFVWNMATYHLILLFSSFVLGYSMPGKVALQLGLDPVGGVRAGTEGYIATWSWFSVIYFSVILILDFWLLAIIKGELKPKITDVDKYGIQKKEWLTYPRLILFEGFIFVIGIFNPYVRAGMLFFGANTIQIAIVKLWMIKEWRPKRFQFGIFAQYFFILGSYLLILDAIRKIIIHFWTCGCW